jgi:hypothetical protein
VETVAATQKTQVPSSLLEKPLSDVLLQIVLCILLADFITGVAHWFEQCYGLPSWPIIGRAIIGPNIRHHITPAAICDGTLLSRNWQMWTFAASVVGVVWLCGWFTWQFSVVALVASFGNETHSWAHGRAPKFARVLQDMGVLLSPRQHAQHHKPPFAETYCTVTCWVNPILDACYFWTFIEMLLWFAGYKPKRMSAERNFV